MEEYTSAYATVKIATSNEEDALDQSVFDTENDEDGDSEESEELEDIGDYDEETLAEQDMLDGDPDDIDEEEEEQ